MVYQRMAITWIVSFLLVIGAGTVHAQRPEDTKYSFGAVVRASAGEIVVTEFREDLRQDVETTYEISADIELLNASQMSDIVPGDSVDITYVEKAGKRVAVAILVEKLAEIVEPVPEEFYEE